MYHNLAFIVIFVAVPALAQIDFSAPHYYQNHERLSAYIHRTYTDPARLGWLLFDSAIATSSHDPNQWDRNAEGFSYRFASGWGRRIVRNTIQTGFEAALHEDSRYRPSHEIGYRRRIFFAVSHSVLAYKPDGRVTPAYGRIAADFGGVATTSTWHPQSIDGCALLSAAATSALDRAGGNLLTEFEPELKYFGHRALNRFRAK